MPFRLPPPPRLTRPGGILLAAGLPLLALFVSLPLRPQVYSAPFALFFLATAVVGYAGGALPGLVSVAISALLGMDFLVPPYSGFGLSREEILAGALFVPIGSILVMLAASLRAGYLERAASADWFRMLADVSPQLMFTMASNGSGVYHNRRFLEYTGRAAEELRGRAWLELVHPDDAARGRALFSQLEQEGRAGAAELRLRRHDGEYRWFVASFVPLRGRQGEIARWYGSCADIQSQKESDLAKTEAIHARDMFLSVASHELKTPLTAALLQVQAAQRLLGDGSKASAEVVSRRLAGVAASIERFGGLVEVLLDVSRMAVGRLELGRSAYDLSAAVLATVARFGEAAQREQVQLEADVEESVEATGDRLRTEQVVANLLSNAIKYGRGRPVRVALRRQGGRAVLSVSDSGIGIATEDQQRIFHRFERGGAPREYGGLGLGLWISRGIVEASGGTIEVSSRRGEGTTFTVQLPVDGPRAAAAARPAR
jgi:PAS domain S-box-containing protein